MDTSVRANAAARLRSFIARFTPTIPYLTHEDFAALDSPVIIDVRTPEETELGTIPGAQPLSSLDTALSNVPVSAPVVMFCTVGLRSGAYGARIAGQRPHVYNYSIVEHLWADGVLQRPDGSVWERTVHVYSKRCDAYFPPGLATSYFGPIASAYKLLHVVPPILITAFACLRRFVLGHPMEPAMPHFRNLQE